MKLTTKVRRALVKVADEVRASRSEGVYVAKRHYVHTNGTTPNSFADHITAALRAKGFQVTIKDSINHFATWPRGAYFKCVFVAQETTDGEVQTKKESAAAGAPSPAGTNRR